MGGRVAREAQHSSRNAFFDHRADTVEVKDLFRSDKVTEFSCTLDKVTVQHHSFTVLLTFFFMDGKIYNSSVRCTTGTSVFRRDNEAGC